MSLEGQIVSSSQGLGDQEVLRRAAKTSAKICTEGYFSQTILTHLAKEMTPDDALRHIQAQHRYAYKDSPYTAHHNHNEEPHMQIRIRKHTLSLIRNDYDPALKRGRSTYLGGMPIDSLVIPPQIDVKLRVEERKQLLSELKKLHSAREIEMEELAGRLLPINLRRAIRWYDRQESSDELSSLAKECREIWTELLAAMVRAGVGRTRHRKVRGTSKSGKG